MNKVLNLEFYSNFRAQGYCPVVIHKPTWMELVARHKAYIG